MTGAKSHHLGEPQRPCAICSPRAKLSYRTSSAYTHPFATSRPTSQGTVVPARERGAKGKEKKRESFKKRLEITPEETTEKGVGKGEEKVIKKWLISREHRILFPFPHLFLLLFLSLFPFLFLSFTFFPFPSLLFSSITPSF
ncbi:hypothetical protein IE53DRAFT_7636 [Violaceomyces palustris]|uniref:Uncharacterized protein n=1 Tax=Violaceomyces palustris TaxID=1673888 RepID=A0ACD0NLQ2_9BASI|nr:hypothetical protein IE53DRAFT_7636 [Violaceomyces palustris]